MDTSSTKGKSKAIKEMVMGSLSVRRKKMKRFMKVTGKMIEEMAKEQVCGKTSIIDVKPNTKESGKMILDMEKESNMLLASMMIRKRLMMENGNPTKEQAKERYTIRVKISYTLADSWMARRMEME